MGYFLFSTFTAGDSRFRQQLFSWVLFHPHHHVSSSLCLSSPYITSFHFPFLLLFLSVFYFFFSTLSNSPPFHTYLFLFNPQFLTGPLLPILFLSPPILLYFINHSYLRFRFNMWFRPLMYLLLQKMKIKQLKSIVNFSAFHFEAQHSCWVSGVHSFQNGIGLRYWMVCQWWRWGSKGKA